MIEFACPRCGRTFAVPESFAGRTANCKTCRTPLVVPPAGAAPAGTISSESPTPPTAARSTGAYATPAGAAGNASPRTQRLLADARQMAEAFAGHPLIKVRPVAGDPPESYHVDYAVRGLERGKGNRPVPRKHHAVEIRLPGDYPRTAPKCKMLTPIFHPNIDPTTVSLPDPWSATQRLVDLTLRIGEMIAFQSYDLASPLDADAAMWADLNPQSLPTDPRPLRPTGSRLP